MAKGSIIQTTAEGNEVSGQDVTVGPDGSVYVAATFNHRIRRIHPDGTITVVAGNGSLGSSGDGGLATEAAIGNPTGVDLGPDGSLYIVNALGRKVRRVDPNGIITTVAGGGPTAGDVGDGGPAVGARLQGPMKVAVAGDGTFYIADTNNRRVRKVSPDGIITTVAGNGQLGTDGVGGPATEAEVTPQAVALGPDGVLYIATFSRILRLESNGILTRVAGAGTGFGGDGGPAINAMFRFIRDIEVGPDDSIYVADTSNRRVRQIRSDGIVFTLAGTGETGFNGDGQLALQADMTPQGVAVGQDGTIYIADSGRVREIVSPLPGLTDANFVLASQDGSELYTFDLQGRHLCTRNTLAGAVIRQFGYTTGLLTEIHDVVDGDFDPTTVPCNGAIPAGVDTNVTTVQRNAAGDPTAIVGPFGQQTTLALNADSYLETLTNPAQDAFTMSYTSGGLLTSLTNPRQKTATFAYDQNGRLILDDFADDDPQASDGFLQWQRESIPNGHIVTSTSGEGMQTTLQMEFLPNNDQLRTNTFANGTTETLLIQPDGTRIATAADGTITTSVEGPDPRFGMDAPVQTALDITTPGGLISSTTTLREATLADPDDPLSLLTQTETVTLNGREFISEYDATTRELTNTTPENRETVSTLDVQSRVTQTAVTGLDPIQFTYDTSGRLGTITQGSGAEQRQTSLSYNSEGLLATVTDPSLQDVQFEYDDAGRVTKQVLPDLREILFGYDAQGNLTAITPPGRPAHTFDYTAADLEGQYTPPDVGAGTNATVFVYNADRQLDLITRPDGNTVDFQYNQTTGQLDSQALTSRGNVTFAYKGTGQLDHILTPENEKVIFAYDGALLTDTTWEGAVDGTVHREYDNNFRVAEQQVNTETPITFLYDQDSLLTGAGGLTLSRDMDNGLLTSTSLGVVSDTLTYNSFGEPETYAATASGTTVYDVQYTRDKLGRITQKVETIGGTTTTTFEYFYDTAGRLEEVKQDGITAATYTYDSNSNRLTATSGGVTTNGTYDDQDRLTDYGAVDYVYTANGELSQKIDPVSGTTAYVYDELGNLLSVMLPNTTLIEYIIDGRNRRIGKKRDGTLEQGFLYQDQLNPVAELDVNGDIVSQFIYGSKANVPDYMVKGGVTYRIISDHLGSPRLVINTADGTIAQQLAYDEFGKVTFDSAPGFQPFGFAGGLYDRDTELTRFGARDYDAATGRWTAKDPIQFAGGDTNLYGYAVNDPINLVDPAGRNAGRAFVQSLAFHASAGATIAFLTPGGQLASVVLATVAVGAKAAEIVFFPENPGLDTATVITSMMLQQIIRGDPRVNVMMGPLVDLTLETMRDPEGVLEPFLSPESPGSPPGKNFCS